MSSPIHAPKKRQYAPGESQLYYGSAEGQYPADLPDYHQPAAAENIPVPQQAQFVDLMNYPPDPRDLYTPLEVRLPSGLSVLPNPTDSHTVSLHYQSPTIRAVPKTESLLHETKIPLGLVISPYRTPENGEEAVPVVGDGTIARCRRCRGYINPYVQFIDGGNRWRCPLCGLPNDVPQNFQWNPTPDHPGGRYNRLELNHSVVDFVATVEYLRGPPQVPAYVFLLNVSHGVINSGMLHTAIRAISENLERIPNQRSAQVAIICYDVSLYYFAMPPGGGFNMLVVSDLEEAYLPRCYDILVNLSEFRQSVDDLLSRLPDLFADSRTAGSATGPALEGALALLAPTGGKIILLSASAPTIGKGALATDEARRQDTQKVLQYFQVSESGLHPRENAQEPDSEKSASAFYHAFAISCVKACVSVDMFLAGDRYDYLGVATLSLVPHYTSGQVFYYPGFNAGVHEDAVKLAVELGRLLAMPGLLEAEMRVRCSRGIAVKAMHGNFFVQASSRVVMPAIPMDQSYAVQLQIEETLMENMVLFQTAALHTTASGERRIRVLNLALPTTDSASEVFASANSLAITALLAKETVQRTSVLSLEDRRERLCRKLADICAAYMATNKTHSAHLQLLLPPNLKTLPILILGLFKKIAHIDIERMHDARSYARVVLASANIEQLIQYIYPNIYSLHNMPEEVGFVGSEGVLVMPTPLPLTSTCWESHGLYLIDDGQVIYLVVARHAVPRLINDVFGVADYSVLQSRKLNLPEVDTAISQRIRAIIGKIRERRGAIHYPSVCVIKDDDSSGNPVLRSAVAQALIHDRVDSLRFSYKQFLVKVYGK
ncbi:Protein transporter SEC24 [Mycena sanguinolenta]|uniref:Protein transporter SEC24 n=1 Tax=Mycena sanguinolenta TaxID=230812 RepID=A0A8H6Z4T9_9AGAR|nr:Protein transporter SEC24 [Mycena sanguinolenta]